MSYYSNAFLEAYAQLNNEQKLIVDSTDGPCMVLAGPGSGKTQVLALRAARILGQADISPHNIVCITFTDKAATNMRTRIARFVGEVASSQMTIMTFHGLGQWILRRYTSDKSETQDYDETNTATPWLNENVSNSVNGRQDNEKDNKENSRQDTSESGSGSRRASPVDQYQIWRTIFEELTHVHPLGSTMSEPST
jgi:superfamily I DNA/RNA helicase